MFEQSLRNNLNRQNLRTSLESNRNELKTKNVKTGSNRTQIFRACKQLEPNRTVTFG